MPISIGQRSNISTKREPLLFAALALLFTIGIFLATLLKLKALGYNALDLGIFHQVIANTAAGRFFMFTIHPHSYFGDHVSPFLVIIAALYRVVPHVETLLFVQAAAVAIGIWPLAILAKSLPRWLRLLVVASYILNPLVQNLPFFEFELLVFVMPVLLAAILAYRDHRFGRYMFWLLVALSIREDVGLVLLGFGLLAWVDRRSRRWRVAPALLGIAGFLGGMVMTGLVNHEHYKFLSYYGWAGTTLTSAAHYVLTHPWMPVFKLLRPQNLLFTLTAILVFAAIPLLRPRRLIPVVFVVGALFLTNVGGDSVTLRTHYPAFFLPFLFWALIVGLERAIVAPPTWLTRTFDTSGRILPALLLGAVSVYGTLTLGPVRPASIALLWHEASDPRTAIGRALVAATPQSSSPAVSYAFLPYLGNHEMLGSLNYAFRGMRQLSHTPYSLPTSIDRILFDSNDYLFYDVQFRNDGDRFQTGDDRLRALLVRRRFSLATYVDSYLLFLQKPGDNPESLVTFGEKPGRPVTQSTGALPLVAVDGQKPQLETTPYSFNGTTVETLPVALTWQTSSQPKTTSHLLVEYVDSSGTVRAHHWYALGYGLLPTTEWPAYSTATVRYRWVVPRLPGGHYTVRVQTSAITDGYLTLDPALTAIVDATRKPDGPAVVIGTLDR